MHRLTHGILSSLILCHSSKITKKMTAASLTSLFTPSSGRLLDSKTIDKESFKKQVTFPAIKIDTKFVNNCRKAFKKSLIQRKQFSYIREDSSTQSNRYLLLNPEKVQDFDSLSEQERTFLDECGAEKKLHEFETELCYENWNSDEVLRCILPKGMEVPTSFSTIGHIAHMNLREEQLQYKYVIGEVLLDKNPRLKTVVNKVNEIDNEFRFFKMELLAGKDNMVALVREHGLAFEFDFSKVYWNSRLSTEHTRIASKLGRQDILYDMFAGVGPFAIPAAKRKSTVFANDLNPESYKWLDHNVKLNKVQDRVKTYNLDARKFVLDVVKDDLISLGQKCKEGEEFNTHVVMNLPSIAIEFLDVFCNLLSDVPSDLRPHIPLPMMHCHCFSKADDMHQDICNRIQEVLQHQDLDNIVIHDVRDVAPNKEMMCPTFRLSSSVAFGSSLTDGSSPSEPDAKKQRCE